VDKPISFSFLLAALALLAIIALPNIRKKREEVFVEET
jgi:TctA family transporter